MFSALATVTRARIPGVWAVLVVALCLAWASPADAGRGARAPAARAKAPTSQRAARRVLRELPAGESHMPHAPRVRIDGTSVVPSQYKLFRHTGETVQGIVSGIRYKSNFAILVGGGKKDGVYIQVGIIGPDNYPLGRRDLPSKIVYGRKWRVETFLPTSELIQTVFLAIKSAEEHELREQFVVSGTTPFNSHLDLPLLATHQVGRGKPNVAVEPKLDSEEKLADALADVRIGGHLARVVDATPRASGKVVFDVELVADPKMPQNPLLGGKTLTVIADTATHTGVVRGLFDAALAEVHREVDERFTYQDFARFSRRIPVSELVEFNRAHRSADRVEMDATFPAVGAALNRAIDATRPPRIHPGPANDRAQDAIRRAEAQGPLLGDRPRIVSE